MEENEDIIDLAPKKGDDVVRIPSTFSYRGGSDENEKQKILIGLITGVILLFLLITLWSGERSVFGKLVYTTVYLFIEKTIIEKYIVNKKKYITATEQLENNDYIFDEKCYWSIYEISEEYPHFCYFKNGEIGIFFKMEKDVALGNVEDVEFNHYEAIADALCVIGHAKGKIKLRHIDDMGTIGNDNRIDVLIEGLKDTKCEALKELYTKIYGDLKESLQDEFEANDTYLIRGKCRKEEIEEYAMRVIGRMLEGNYISYSILNKKGIRSIVMSIMNLHNFSVVSACDLVKGSQLIKGITPIYSMSSSGKKIVYNLTQEERKEEMRIKEEEKRAKSSRKKNKNNEKIDISDLGGK